MSYAWGIGFHWYETWTGGDPKYDNIKSINATFPSKKILFTEGCQENLIQTNTKDGLMQKGMEML